MECVIREWSIDDSDDLARALNNKNIHNNLRDGLPYPYNKKDAIQFIEGIKADASNYCFAISVDGKAVGCIGVQRLNNVHRLTGELGYYVAEPFWGRGIGTTAVKSICRFIFENTDIVRIFAEPFEYNNASCRILEKAGFLLEGVLRDNAVKNDKILNMKMYSLIKEDFIGVEGIR